MATKKFLVDENGNKFYPMAHAQATYDKNGALLQTVIDALPTSDTKYTFTQNGTTLTVTGTDGSSKTITLGEDITSAKIISALGFTPANATAVPDSLSDLTDDATHRLVTDTEKSTWNGKANTATTLAGYGITDAVKNDDSRLTDARPSSDVTDTYSATGTVPVSGKAVASAISTAISGVTQFDYEVVSTLPTTGTKGKIYLVADSHGEKDIYDEYIYVNNAWEKIGNTDIDLSGYQTKLSDTQLAAANSGITSTKVSTYDGYSATIGGKVDKVDGKGLSANDLTDTLKSNYDAAYTHSQSAHAPSGAQANVIETVKVNGTALTPSNKAVDITVPSEVTESTVSGWGFTKNSGTYSKPSGGIPKTDLASAVQTSLGKADSALQSYTETDPVFSASAAAGITSANISTWNGKASTAVATTSANGLMSSTDKAKLDNVGETIYSAILPTGKTAGTVWVGSNSL